MGDPRRAFYAFFSWWKNYRHLFMGLVFNSVVGGGAATGFDLKVLKQGKIVAK